MNQAKWDAIAEAFDAGTFVPANGWDAWHEQAVQEAVMIRQALPSTVGTLVEVGCGVGRLTPYLAIMFPRILATDTSSACRQVTRRRCHARRNVTVMAPDNLYVKGDAALVWGNLYDSDWSPAAAQAHRFGLREAFPLVLEGNAEQWMLWEATGPTLCTIRTYQK